MIWWPRQMPKVGMPVHAFAGGGDGVVAGLGVARAVGEEDAVGLQARTSAAGVRRHHRDPAVAIGEHPEDVELDAVVVGDDMALGRRELAVATAERPGRLLPFVRRFDAHHLGQVESGHRRRRAGLGQRRVDRRRSDLRAAREGDDAAVLRAAGAQQPGQATGVDAGDRHRVRAAGTRPAGRCAEVGNPRRHVLDHQAGGEDLARLDVLRARRRSCRCADRSA